MEFSYSFKKVKGGNEALEAKIKELEKELQEKEKRIGELEGKVAEKVKEEESKMVGNTPGSMVVDKNARIGYIMSILS